MWPKLVLFVKTWGIWLTLASLIVSVCGLWVIGWIIIRLPEDHFLEDEPTLLERHPALQILTVLVRNVLGVLLIMMGIAMLVMPGQGLLTIILGVSISAFPGRQALNDWLLCRATTRKSLNWLREVAGAEPFRWPPNCLSESEHQN